ncbi:MAG: hypothetical protein AMS24_04415 [Chlamydiae bacterium SM23_39]|nr:MAG: hypothetical protein AMS24_04415 [Chlamydiae bacterium SM23_39]
MIRSYGFSDIGTSRSKNEDILTILKNHNFFMVADGMGGHKAGEVAAREATEEICNSIYTNINIKEELSPKIIYNLLYLAISNANKRVFSLSKKNKSFDGMGTTLSCLHLSKNSFTYGHIGDSRIYLFRKNRLKQLTKDHSLINISTQKKNIITKAIGTCSYVQPEIKSKKIFSKDIFFMCTDGLSDYISSDEIMKILKNNSSQKKAVTTLIETAKKNGSSDNITAILIEVL